MAFTEEVPLWKVSLTRRQNNGSAPKIYDDPEMFLADAYEYFQWVEDNPLYEHKLVLENKHINEMSVPKKRAMSVAAMCIFLGIAEQTFRRAEHLDEWEHTVATVKMIIRTQKFEAAAAGLMDSNIVMRDLGLQDRKLIGGDPDNPLPSQVAIFHLPDNGRDSVIDHVPSPKLINSESSPPVDGELVPASQAPPRD